MSETVSTSAPSAPSTGSVSQGTQSASPTQAQQTATSIAPPTQSAHQTPGAEASQKPEAPAKRYLEQDADEALVKVKVDGVEQELTVKELKRLSSLERASQKRMQESAKVQKQFQNMLDSLKNDPAQVLKQIGKDPDMWAEELLARKYELMQMSPEQRENVELKARIDAQERADRESKRGVIDEIKKLSDRVPENIEKYSKEDLANYRDHLVSVNRQAQQSLEQEMISAWQESKLPKHKTFGNWMAMEMMAHEKRTGEPLQAKDAAVKVKADFLKFTRSILSGMDASAILESLGQELVQKVIDHKIQGVTEQAAQGFQSPAQPAVSEPKKPYMSEIEYRKWLKGG